MYNILSSVSQLIMEPVDILLQSFENSPIIVALLLGLLGAVAPCQLTGNMSAITLFGNRSIQLKQNVSEVISFIVGKVVVFSGLGLLVWFLGETFQNTLIEYFALFRKIIGPLIIATGLVLLGIMKLKFLTNIPRYIPVRMRNGIVGSFFLGVSFSLAFCPTMFVLFFLWLMPLVATTTYGFVLPAVFGVATSIPLIMLFLFIWLVDAKRLVMKSSMKVGSIIQRTAGVILIVIGLVDTITYWQV
ncbi:cytochrome C biosynthesis protein [Sporosarcina sp. P21c]|uniref:urease accessory protein UreH domain-containing protein n=1 Tax=unclassified Sporosarcina TaxID=2647733 RepID=UPI000C16FF8C|nr:MULTISPECIES: sulfite exporter TauE/SafE family protein [unclassified Sporosarcina]PIC67435.1 cytochrome C biosynthesis protein [Sporosarcina sp. P16a]PIC89690.1 cytochrome C biosynthesis protein [Sporosarcina sp. P21c]PIC92886.1 cytochrome C biosynthesis protein [Sporosarcina sp. P25]